MQAAQLDRQLRPIYGEHSSVRLLPSSHLDAFASALPRRYRFRIEQDRDLNMQ